LEGSRIVTTELKYLEDAELYESEARVTLVEAVGGGSNAVNIVLDETVFYPQGGGQPTDRGRITTAGGAAEISHVSFRDGDVFHFGRVVSGAISEGEVAKLTIDVDLRRLHARLHTGGHLVMTAVDRLLGLPAIKGYHFPNGPYVEFEGTVPVERREAMAHEIQDELNHLVEEDSAVTWRYDTVENMRAVGIYIPMEIPEGKPTRVVITSGYQAPCGGTHVKKLGELQGLRAKSIKTKSGKTRVSYLLD
jgi:Ser-tRNA(Ala) deacylase AlaX